MFRRVRTTRLYGLRRAIWRVRRSVPRVARPLSRVLPERRARRRIRSSSSAARDRGRRSSSTHCARAASSLRCRARATSSGTSSTTLATHGWGSDAVGPSEIAHGEREYLYLAIRLFARGGRFVDKTPANCLRVLYLQALFPGATFVFLRRRGPDNVSSLIEGWRACTALRALSPAGAAHRPRRARRRPLELRPRARLERAARRFARGDLRASVRGVQPCRVGRPDIEYGVMGRPGVRGPRRRRPQTSCGASTASWACPSPARSSGSRESSRRARSPRRALTAPQREKWRERNEAAVERVWPQLEDMERRLGYGT